MSRLEPDSYVYNSRWRFCGAGLFGSGLFWLPEIVSLLATSRFYSNHQMGHIIIRSMILSAEAFTSTGIFYVQSHRDVSFSFPTTALRRLPSRWSQCYLLKTFRNHSLFPPPSPSPPAALLAPDPSPLATPFPVSANPLPAPFTPSYASPAAPVAPFLTLPAASAAP